MGSCGRPAAARPTTVNGQRPGAKTQLSRLLERAHAGEEVVIGKNGKPYARLCPLTTLPDRIPGLLKGKVEEAFFEPLPAAELEAWEAAAADPAGRKGRP